MIELFSINSLAIVLSKLKTFENPKIKLEQHTTESNIASDLLFKINQIDSIENKVILDAGCGQGILGIGALLLNAKKIYFLDIDKDAITILKKNLKDIQKYLKETKINKKLNYAIINSNISEIDNTIFNDEIDIIIQNPPFGTKLKNADRCFLETAFKLTNIIYHFHKTTTTIFISKISVKNNFFQTNIFDYSFHLKQEHKHQTSQKKRIDVSVSRLEKNN